MAWNTASARFAHVMAVKHAQGARNGRGARILHPRAGAHLTHTVVTRRSHTLVTGGLYRFVRHPLYCSAAVLAVLAVATSMTMANRFVLLTGALVFLLL